MDMTHQPSARSALTLKRKETGELFSVKISKKDRNCFYLDCKRSIPIGMRASAFYPDGKRMAFICNFCRRQYHCQEVS